MMTVNMNTPVCWNDTQLQVWVPVTGLNNLVYPYHSWLLIRRHSVQILAGLLVILTGLAWLCDLAPWNWSQLQLSKSLLPTTHIKHHGVVISTSSLYSECSRRKSQSWSWLPWLILTLLSLSPSTQMQALYHKLCHCYFLIQSFLFIIH
jgi:hypothetical protein